MKMLYKLFKIKTAQGKSFFDYSSREKKKIVKDAAIGSNKLQAELVRKCSKVYSCK